MRIKLDLNYLLMKNGVTLPDFLTKMNIKSYDELKKHCDKKNLVPVSEEVFNSIISPRLESRKEETQDGETTPKKARNKRGTASQTQKKPRRRPSSKKVKDA